MRRIYSKKLGTKERRRIADALYRLRKRGYEIPEAEVWKISKTRSYEEIYQQAVKLPGARFRAIRTDSRGHTYRAEGSVPAQLAYKLEKKLAGWQRSVEKFIRKAPSTSELFPQYKLEALGPSFFETFGMTAAEIDAAYESRFKAVLKTVTYHKPESYLKKATRQTVKNLGKALRHSVRPLSNELYKAIMKKLQALSPVELHDLYNSIGHKVFDALFHYAPEMVRLGVASPVGDVVAPIIQLAITLGIDPGMQFKLTGTREKLPIYDIFDLVG